MTPEGRTKALINRRLKPLIDIGKVWKLMPVPSTYGAISLDYILCAGGWFIGIEAKRPGGKPTAQQALTMRLIQKAGGQCFTVDGEESLDTAMKVIVRCIRNAHTAAASC